ncbi:MAG TPA: hydroxypyruvate isomerase [Dissulfurispiraceae bacterium]|nr:hydroxypyruvate isomerase [Dissulfurispiraceae bacterium]
MPRFSANLSMLFQEHDFLDRFEKAKEAGFTGVEYLFPYQWPPEHLAALLVSYGLTQVLHNLPAGDWAGGERGIACLPGRESEFQDGVARALSYARQLGCMRLNCLAGKRPEGVDDEKLEQTLVANLSFAAPLLEEAGIKLLIEPLNSRDIPRFFLVHTADALSIMQRVNHPNLYLQYDVYHMQVMEGNLIQTITNNLESIAHIQIADNPGRHEPGTGEINYASIFRALDESGYSGWVGCEFLPLTTTEEGLRWMNPYRNQTR